MTVKLLHICARATTFPGLAALIDGACGQVHDWDRLLTEAEAHGLAPLLHWHLQTRASEIPEHCRRALRLLYLRHRHANTVYGRVLGEVLTIFAKAGIEALVLKGAALCHTVYPEIGLRPMRDIDLLLPPDKAQQAQDLLIARGYAASNAPQPIDHFHLPSLHTTIDGLTVCIEIHLRLFPDCPPYYRRHDFASLRPRAVLFNLAGWQALTLGHEDMLWHVFHHGFHAPLTYEPFKLIAAADIITLIETRWMEIDRQVMEAEYPEVLRALPLLGCLTPWQDQVAEKFVPGPAISPAAVGEPFKGWPRWHLREQRGKSLLAILRDTFLPPEWWARLYYGVDGRLAWYRCRWFTHPRHITWWVRLYSSFLDHGADRQNNGQGGTLRRIGRRLAALRRKFI
ncbi:MAG: nucleotidyltransferase family protein [Desulforhopalus sp.]|nr:nucleotidyltransferase family protein [Desulforhopalus sp.]